MNRQQALALIRDIMSAAEDVHIRIPLEELEAEHELATHLGLDSLGRIGFFYELTDRLGVDADEAEGDAWKTLGDVLDFIERKRK